MNARAIDLFVDGASDALFAAVGGSDFSARYRLSDGELIWKIDTSGASQAIARYDDDHVIVVGHFRWVASQPTMQCGSNSHPTGECERRGRLVALGADTGSLDATWAPDVKPFYFGVWSVLVRKDLLHVGGEFLEIEDVAQHYYARLPVTSMFSRS